MGLFSRKPEFQDAALADLAQMFISFPEDPTPGSNSLDATKLDFSVNSLQVVDEHLEHIRAHNLEDKHQAKLILRCGAYVGEVIRRNSTTKTYHWLDYKSALKLESKLANFGENLGTAAVLWDNKTGFTFPLGKVIKYLKNGSEDSVYFFAKVIISKND